MAAPVGRGEGALLSLFRKGDHLIYEGSALMPYSPPEAPPLSTITVGIRIPTYEFGGDVNI